MKYFRRAFLVVLALCVTLSFLMPSSASAQASVSCAGVTVWVPGIGVNVGELVTYNNQEFKALQAHTTETGWEPPNVPALFSLLGNCASAAPDFLVSAMPGSQTLTPGASMTDTVTVSAVNGFTGTVSLSVSGLPSGATGSFSPASVNGAGTATLTVATASSTVLATYTLTITGTSGGLTHSTTVTLIVQAAATPDFSISATPNSQMATAGGSASYTVTVGAVNGFAGTVSLSVSGLPSGATGSFSPASVSGSGNATLTVATGSATPLATSTFTITGANGGLTHTASLTLVVIATSGSGSGSCASAWNASTVYASPGTMVSENGVNYANNFWTQGDDPATRNGGPGSGQPWTATANCSGTGGTPAANFAISASASSQVVTRGGSTSYTAAVSALNGFTGAVSLSVSGLPSGATGSFSPPSVNGAGTATLTVTTSSATPLATSTLMLTGTSGSVTHSATVTLVVQAGATPADFSISATPSSQGLIPGGSTSYTTTVSALNGFTGAVSLSVSGLPSGVTGSFSPASVNGSGNATLTVGTTSATPLAASTLTITGTSGSLTHTASVTLSVNGNSLPAHILEGYWQDFTNGAKNLTIAQVPSGYNIIAVAFANATSTPGAVSFSIDSTLASALGGYTDAQFKADINTAHSRGQKVIVSVGGQNGTISVSDATSAANFANSVSALMTTWGFDGVDIDLENGVNPQFMGNALNQLASMHPGMIITMAPQTVDVQATSGDYFQLALNIGSKLTVMNTQYYNSGTMLGCDGGVYASGTEDFETALACIQLKGGLSPSVVGLGLPASANAAGSGLVAPSVVVNSLNCLATGTSCGTFLPPAKWPAIRGAMTWSINWDASNNFNFVNTLAPALSTLP